MSIEAVLANEEWFHVEVGDVIKGMRKCPAGVVQTIITSPPYWNLRSYLPSEHPDKSSEIGGEPTPEAFIKKLVKVFREAKRILRDDGTLFVNLGDSYAQDKKWGGKTGGKHAKGLHGTTGIGRNRTQTGLDGGNLVGIPFRFAFAMQADGWHLRSVIIWAKKSPMPESINGWRWTRCRIKVSAQVKGKQNGAIYQARSRDMSNGQYLGSAVWKSCPGCDKCRANGGMVLRRGKWRPTTSHEYIFMFSKSDRYFCDSQAIQEPTTGNAHSRGTGLNPKARSIDSGNHKDRPKQNDSFSAACNQVVGTRNPRTVWGSIWQFGNEPEKAKHFAAFPSAVPRKCLKAALSSAGCCPKCGASYAPVVESERKPTRPGTNTKTQKSDAAGVMPQRLDSTTIGNRDPQRHTTKSNVTGHRPTCGCNAGDPVPSIVADIFSGTGTTGRVAYSLGYRYLGFELFEEYAAISREKIVRPFLKKKSPKHKRPMDCQKPLFE